MFTGDSGRRGMRQLSSGFNTSTVISNLEVGLGEDLIDAHKQFIQVWHNPTIVGTQRYKGSSVADFGVNVCLSHQNVCAEIQISCVKNEQKTE